MIHFLIAISGHGFGHAGQICPVINALASRILQTGFTLKLTILTTVPRSLLQQRLTHEFSYLYQQVDPGMIMENALTVHIPASQLAYQQFHADWPQAIAKCTAQLAALHQSCPVTAVIADVPYLILEAAATLDIPSIALCSLNWADIYAAFMPADCAENRPILHQIRNAYAKARVFIQPEPSMPMPQLAGLVPFYTVGPIASVGPNHPTRLRQRLSLPANAKIVLVSLGGIATPLDFSAFPTHINDENGVSGPIFWLVEKADEAARHPQAIPLAAAALPFIQILASVDAFLTKPGYGSCAEGVCHGIPLILVNRAQWPEQPALLQWVLAKKRGRVIEWADLTQGNALSAALQWAFFQAGHFTPLPPSGIETSVDIMLANSVGSTGQPVVP